jgi:predicted DNA-binding transcriptional regulator AlpA
MTTTSIEPQELITEVKAAKLLGVKPRTLTNWRAEKVGPAFIKVGRSVYYTNADITAWLTSQRRCPKVA